MNIQFYGTLRILRFAGQSIGIVLLSLQHPTLSPTIHCLNLSSGIRPYTTRIFVSESFIEFALRERDSLV